MTTSPIMRFAERLVFLKGQLIDFTGRPYLPAIYNSTARNLVLRTSRQVEKSTFLALMILYLAVTCPGIQILLVCPRLEQAQVFMSTRLLSILTESPILRRALLGKTRRTKVMNQAFANGSNLFVRAAFHTADSIRGISADVLLIDEFQDIAAGDLPVIREVQSHAKKPRMILCGTPKLIDNHLEAAFNESTAQEWRVRCPACGQDVALDERSMGPTGIVCPDCQAPLDAQTGRWIARNPNATWGDGYWINALMVPWRTNYDDILENQRSYASAQFRNEVLGLPVSLGDHVVTEQQLEACCTDTPMAKSIEDIPAEFRRNVVAGIDWGAGGSARTAIVVGFARPEGAFEICHLATIRGREDFEEVKRQTLELCRQFRVRWIGADGLGSGSIYNRQLRTELQFGAELYALNYSETDGRPAQDGILWKAAIARTGSIGHLIACIQKRKVRFPRLEDCRPFLADFAAEVAEYDDQRRAIKYTHATTQPDDVLHAANYALQIVTWGFHKFVD